MIPRQTRWRTDRTPSGRRCGKGPGGCALRKAREEDKIQGQAGRRGRGRDAKRKSWRCSFSASGRFPSHWALPVTRATCACQIRVANHTRDPPPTRSPVRAARPATPDRSDACLRRASPSPCASISVLIPLQIAPTNLNDASITHITTRSGSHRLASYRPNAMVGAP